jgi:hypothetical protein
VKQHWLSRPLSTVSYSCNDAPAYSPSPAVEHCVTVPVALSHPEAIDQFNVSGLLAFVINSTNVTLEPGEGLRGCA